MKPSKYTESHIHHHIHYDVDSLFFKVRKFALFFLFVLLIAGLSLSVCGVLGLLPL